MLGPRIGGGRDQVNGEADWVLHPFVVLWDMVLTVWYEEDL
jgi:hypothetical protein